MPPTRMNPLDGRAGRQRRHVEQQDLFHVAGGRRPEPAAPTGTTSPALT
jgi:hypothetical protein